MSISPGRRAQGAERQLVKWSNGQIVEIVQVVKVVQVVQVVQVVEIVEDVESVNIAYNSQGQYSRITDNG